MPEIPIFTNAYRWAQVSSITDRGFICGFCGRTVSSNRGFQIETNNNVKAYKGGIHICPHCQGPNLFTTDNEQVPAPAIGNPVPNVPTDVNKLYDEARRCTTTGCYTAAVLLCRKMLMNIAVQEGAQEGKRFIEYIQYLSDKNYVPPKGKHWVDHIRKKGNEATHEIALKTKNDATDLLNFVEMLLRLSYDFPSRVPATPPAT